MSGINDKILESILLDELNAEIDLMILNEAGRLVKNIPYSVGYISALIDVQEKISDLKTSDFKEDD